MLPVSVTRGASVASGLLVVLLLGSCGGGEGDGVAPPTISPGRTPTATLPTLPSPTRSPERTQSPELPSPSPTRSPDRTQSTDDPAPERSSPPPAQEPATRTPTPTAQETADSGDPAADEPVQDSAEDEAVPTWVWWLLAAVVVGSVVAVPLVLRARRRSAWRRELAEGEGELAWFARELLPGLRLAGSRELAASGWAVGRVRVAAAEDRLTVLESTAPDEAGRQRARSLRDAGREAWARMEQLTGPEPSDTWALDLDAIIADLELALRPTPVSSPE
jgi:hypothetical protein